MVGFIIPTSKFGAEMGFFYQTGYFSVLEDYPHYSIVETWISMN
jgi:hypothetical protein